MLRRRLVATNFQPTSARSAFPCWDEPQYKANFKISAVRQRDYLTLSNMPLDNTEDVSIFWGSGLVSLVDRNRRFSVHFTSLDFSNWWKQNKQDMRSEFPLAGNSSYSLRSKGEWENCCWNQTYFHAYNCFASKDFELKEIYYYHNTSIYILRAQV